MEENEVMNEAVETEESGMEELENEMWNDDSFIAEDEDGEATVLDGDTGEEFTEEDSDADQQEEDESDTDDDGTDTETQDAEENSQTRKFTLKHLDETKEVDETEVVELAQKGMDYDRVRGKYDELKTKQQRYDELEGFLEEIKGDFPTIDDLMDDTRAKMLQRNDKSLTYEKALSTVKEQRKTSAGPKETDIGIDEFLQAYPEVKADSIPKEVWDDVNVTKNLKRSYEFYNMKKENAELKEKVGSLEKGNEILEQNSKNKNRSVGSMKSSGNGRKKSMEDLLWDED